MRAPKHHGIYSATRGWCLLLPIHHGMVTSPPNTTSYRGNTAVFHLGKITQKSPEKLQHKRPQSRRQITRHNIMDDFFVRERRREASANTPASGALRGQLPPSACRQSLSPGTAGAPPQKSGGLFHQTHDRHESKLNIQRTGPEAKGANACWLCSEVHEEAVKPRGWSLQLAASVADHTRKIIGKAGNRL